MRVTGLPLNSLVRRKEIPDASSSSSSSSQQQQEQVMTSIADEIDEIVTVGPFDEGSVVVLECNSLHGRPSPQVAWFNGSKVMSSKTVITPDSEEGRVTSAVSFVLTRSDLTSQFSCRVWNNATVRPIIRWITFDVHGEFSSVIFLCHSKFFLFPALSFCLSHSYSSSHPLFLFLSSSLPLFPSLPLSPLRPANCTHSFQFSQAHELARARSHQWSG